MGWLSAFSALARQHEGGQGGQEKACGYGCSGHDLKYGSGEAD
jgi:hypothetical protein